MSVGRAPRVWSIAAGAPFLEILADSLMSGAAFGRETPLSAAEIADATLFLPTRRAANAFGRVMAEKAANGAVLLPKIVLLGDPEPDSSPGAGLRASAALAPAIDPLARRLMLFELVDGWRQVIDRERAGRGENEPFYVAKSRADAFALAGDLASLIDEAIIEDVPLARLAGGPPPDFDPARHDAYWSLTAKFLQIAAQAWPETLVEHGLLDAVERSNALVRALVLEMEKTPPQGPVIVAGSTGSVAATAELMRAVSRLPMGAVILPGLDRTLEDGAWDAIGAPDADLATRYGHPQGMLKRTLQRIGISREEVVDLGVAGGRQRLVSEVFRPSQTTEAWTGLSFAAPEGLALVEAADGREEALAIALILREALEAPGRTAALVTPDRMLARAVQSELERWGVRVSDTADQPLKDAPGGALARLALRAARPEAGGADLLALLRHPLIAHTPADEAAVDAIELAALRGARWEHRLSDLPAYLSRAAREPPSHRDPAARRRVPQGALERAADLASRIVQALGAFAGAFASGTAPLGVAARAHRECLSALLGLESEAAPPPECAPVFDLIDDLIAAADPGPDLPLEDYIGIFEDLAAGATLPPAGASHPRLAILGLLEARLMHADRLVLGGLSEGIWPPEARGDPFLNRPMRIAFGLQPPERRIGQTAHDFQMLLAHPDVILTRAQKREGAPAIASRFWRRLAACLGADHAKAMMAQGRRYLDWARALDRPETVTPAQRPAPRIARELMPQRLNLTEVEALYRDPYEIFARRVLKLDALEPLDPPPDGRERGTLMHGILAAYAQAFPDAAPLDGAGELTRLGRQAFAGIAARDPVAARFWWRRFEAFAPWFANWDAGRRDGLTRMHAETPGRLDIPLLAGLALTLSTRADRIEERADGLAIIDFKTGAPPSGNQVLKGLAPQLPLTAALAARGAFEGVPAARAGELAYVQVATTGGAGVFKAVKSGKDGDIADIAERQFQALAAALREFASGTRAFLSRRMPEKTAYAGDYDLLARHLEWSLGGGTGDNGEDEA